MMESNDRKALRLAEQFIRNGAELGYIRMPTIDDPALYTLPAICAALARPDPCAALADALRSLLDAVEGNHLTVGDCNQARSALAAYEGSKS
jgi:hypothetical protein